MSVSFLCASQIPTNALIMVGFTLLGSIVFGKKIIIILTKINDIHSFKLIEYISIQ